MKSRPAMIALMSNVELPVNANEADLNKLLVAGQPITSVGRAALMVEVWKHRRAMIVMEEFGNRKSKKVEELECENEKLKERIKELERDSFSVIDRLTSEGYLLRFWRAQTEPGGDPMASVTHWKHGTTYPGRGAKSGIALAVCLERVRIVNGE